MSSPSKRKTRKATPSSQQPPPPPAPLPRRSPRGLPPPPPKTAAGPSGEVGRPRKLNRGMSPPPTTTTTAAAVGEEKEVRSRGGPRVSPVPIHRQRLIRDKVKGDGGGGVKRKKGGVVENQVIWPSPPPPEVPPAEKTRRSSSRPSKGVTEAPKGPSLLAQETTISTGAVAGPSPRKSRTKGQDKSPLRRSPTKVVPSPPPPPPAAKTNVVTTGRTRIKARPAGNTAPIAPPAAGTPPKRRTIFPVRPPPPSSSSDSDEDSSSSSDSDTEKAPAPAQRQTARSLTAKGYPVREVEKRKMDDIQTMYPPPPPPKRLMFAPPLPKKTPIAAAVGGPSGSGSTQQMTPSRKSQTLPPPQQVPTTVPDAQVSLPPPLPVNPEASSSSPTPPPQDAQLQTTRETVGVLQQRPPSSDSQNWALYSLYYHKLLKKVGGDVYFDDDSAKGARSLLTKLIDETLERLPANVKDDVANAALMIKVQKKSTTQDVSGCTQVSLEGLQISMSSTQNDNCESNSSTRRLTLSFTGLLAELLDRILVPGGSLLVYGGKRRRISKGKKVIHILPHAEEKLFVFYFFNAKSEYEGDTLSISKRLRKGDLFRWWEVPLFRLTRLGHYRPEEKDEDRRRRQAGGVNQLYIICSMKWALKNQPTVPWDSSVEQEEDLPPADVDTGEENASEDSSSEEEEVRFVGQRRAGIRRNDEEEESDPAAAYRLRRQQQNVVQTAAPPPPGSPSPPPLTIDDFVDMNYFVQGPERPKIHKVAANEDGKYNYTKLQELEDLLTDRSNEEARAGRPPTFQLDQQWFVFGLVEEILPPGAAYPNEYRFRVTDETKKGIMVRICTSKVAPSRGPKIPVGGVVRLHRMNAQVERNAEGKGSMVLSTAPHHNYVLFTEKETTSGRKKIVYDTAAKKATIDTFCKSRVRQLFALRRRQEEEEPPMSSSSLRQFIDAEWDGNSTQSADAAAMPPPNPTPPAANNDRDDDDDQAIDDPGTTTDPGGRGTNTVAEHRPSPPPQPSKKPHQYKPK